MRMFVFQNGQNLASLMKSLQGASSVAISLERVRELNPHVDLARIEPGTVLLVPDGAEGGESIAEATFESLAKDLVDGLGVSKTRVKSGFAAAETRSAEVAAVLNSAPLKKAAAADASLKEQAATVVAQLKSEKQRAKQADAQLEALRGSLDDGLAKLRKLVDK